MLLAVSGLRGDRFGPIDLEVASGEIVGIAGAEGNGQVQFLRALAGAERATGTASCDGKQLDSSSPLGPLRAGVVLLSGDRASESLFPVLSVRANSTIQVLRRLGKVGLLSRRRERRTVDELVKRLSIRTVSIEQPVQTLSGGNQQKVSLTRPFLRGDVRVILAEEPTQGVDVAARFDIYGALREKSKEGVATIVKSSDPLELAGLCDRVVVMSRGLIVDEIPGDELGERRIVEAIVGSRAVARAVATEPRGAGVRLGRFSGALPLVLMTVLIVAVGAFATVRQDAFLTSFNLNNLLLLTMPLALVTLGQTCALLVGGFDVSVAALMTFCVVVASFTMPYDKSGWALRPWGPGARRSGARDWDLQRRAHPRPQASVDHRDARDAQHPRRCIAPPPGSPRRPDLERRRRAVSRRASASFRSPSSSWSSWPSLATCGCTAHAPASPRGQSASTRRRRAGSGWQPAVSYPSRSSPVR